MKLKEKHEHGDYTFHSCVYVLKRLGICTDANFNYASLFMCIRMQIDVEDRKLSGF